MIRSSIRTTPASARGRGRTTRVRRLEVVETTRSSARTMTALHACCDHDDDHYLEREKLSVVTPASEPSKRQMHTNAPSPAAKPAPPANVTAEW